MKFTQYCLYTIQRPDRAKIKMEWIEKTVKNPDYTEVQLDGRIRKWKKIREQGKFLRVILLSGCRIIRIVHHFINTIALMHLDGSLAVSTAFPQSCNENLWDMRSST